MTVARQNVVTGRSVRFPIPPLPLPTLLSQALVAYTIELDNDFEQRTPHVATVKRGTRISDDRPWLVSQAMWTLFLRWVRPEGTPVRELQARAWLTEPGIKSRLHHLEWWRYVTFAPDPSETRAKPRYRDLLVHLTAGGRRACETWAPLAAEVDARWRKRLGVGRAKALQSSLRAVVASGPPSLPDYLPIVDYGPGMRAVLVEPDSSGSGSVAGADLDLSSLLARALLLLTLEFEREAELSMTISANVLRVVAADGELPMRELPKRAGVAKEGVTAAVSFLSKRGYVSVSPDRSKTVCPSESGGAAAAQYASSTRRIEKQWSGSIGKEAITSLRSALEALDLAAGLQPHEGGWRSIKPYAEQTEAFLRDPRGSLPHHPMVLHRGGYPDGA